MTPGESLSVSAASDFTPPWWPPARLRETENVFSDEKRRASPIADRPRTSAQEACARLLGADAPAGSGPVGEDQDCGLRIDRPPGLFLIVEALPADRDAALIWLSRKRRLSGMGIPAFSSLPGLATDASHKPRRLRGKTLHGLWRRCKAVAAQRGTCPPVLLIAQGELRAARRAWLGPNGYLTAGALQHPSNLPAVLPRDMPVWPYTLREHERRGDLDGCLAQERRAEPPVPAQSLGQRMSTEDACAAAAALVLFLRPYVREGAAISMLRVLGP